MEVSFKSDLDSLKLGEGDTFHGEGILAVTKALLQSGVAYVGGYQGAPVSHLMDVLSQSKDLLDELGIHLETCTNEASAAALLGASINYPLRGAVTWKSVVGTNVASDALSHLASSGVKGGAMIIIGEDYGEGASIIQERTHAFATKSAIWLLDPRPDLPSIVHMVEKGFELSEVSCAPVMLELRIRACHVFGQFETKENRPSPYSTNRKFERPAKQDYDLINLPPSTYEHEQKKINERFPAAEKFILKEGLNELFKGKHKDYGIILQGGMYNSVINRLNDMGLADSFGASDIPLLVLNVTYPIVPSQVAGFCKDKKNVLIIEEGQPAYIEEFVRATLHKEGLQTAITGKDVLPLAGEYTAPVLMAGLMEYAARCELPISKGQKFVKEQKKHMDEAQSLLDEALPARPPSFCTGCPERPIFSALSILKEDVGDIHVSSDIGCHTFSTLPPFNIGNSVLGYGMSLASSAAVSGTQKQRPISIMGDGGFWHNGLLSGAASAAFNEDDSILVVVHNGYTSATGAQYIPSSAQQQSPTDIGNALKAVGVKWIKHVRSYSVEEMKQTLNLAMETEEPGLKVIIAEGECQLARQRRVKKENTILLNKGERVVRTKFGVDDEICSGDHACIRLSGCPSLTIKDNPDPLRDNPIAHVNNDCVGCGNCGEVVHAARLCPSFYQADVVQNPTWLDRKLHAVRQKVIAWLGGYSGEVRSS